MNWFKKHLNWAWVIVALSRFVAIPFDSPIPYVVLHTALLALTLWALHQKGRSLLWVLMPIAVLFLHNDRSDNSQDLLNKLNDNWISDSEKQNIRAELIKRGILK